MSRPKTYTPPLKPFLVKALYHEARLQGQPMTTLANRIIERRPYRRVVDLLEVEGIGPAKFRELKGMLRIDAPPP